MMTNKPTISVVLTTYNGERFIEEQLVSILTQTRRPDEVVIKDDCSTDDTINTINKILEKHNDVNCRVLINQKNQGWRANFIEGFHQVSGDIIFCADQDDIWNDDKLEIMEKTMIHHPEINVLASNLTPLYENNATKLADFYVKEYGKGLVAPVEIEEQGFTVLRPGCTMCFRRSILEWIDQIWSEMLAHDEVLWAIGLVTHSLYILNVPLIQFRRHGKNNSPSNVKKIQPKLERAICDFRKLDAILNYSKSLGIDADTKEKVKKLYAFSDKRVKAFENRNVFIVLSLIKNIKQYSTPKSWLADIISVVRG